MTLTLTETGLPCFDSPDQAFAYLRFCEATLGAFDRIPYLDWKSYQVTEIIRDLNYKAERARRYLALWGSRLQFPVIAEPNQFILRRPRFTQAGPAWYRYKQGWWIITDSPVAQQEL